MYVRHDVMMVGFVSCLETILLTWPNSRRPSFRCLLLPGSTIAHVPAEKHARKRTRSL